MAFVPSKSVHKHMVLGVTGEFMFSMVNHIVKSCFAPRPPMLAFLILGVEKEAYIEANRMLSPHRN